MLSASLALLTDMIENHIRDQCILSLNLNRIRIKINNQLTLINQEVR